MSGGPSTMSCVQDRSQQLVWLILYRGICNFSSFFFCFFWPKLQFFLTCDMMTFCLLLSFRRPCMVYVVGYYLIPNICQIIHSLNTKVNICLNNLVGSKFLRLGFECFSGNMGNMQNESPGFVPGFLSDNQVSWRFVLECMEAYIKNQCLQIK